jgi:hypothetical protein
MAISILQGKSSLVDFNQVNGSTADGGFFILDLNNASDNELDICSNFFALLGDSYSVLIENYPENIALDYISLSLVLETTEQKLDYNSMDGITQEMINDFVELMKSKVVVQESPI